MRPSRQRESLRGVAFPGTLSSLPRSSVTPADSDVATHAVPGVERISQAAPLAGLPGSERWKHL
ncbi:exported hypothetical protein [Candidatus Sulfotelmatomonas gaucii]|uniref:Uncharacterized protein n=1 Tax=Candidatus Sulfuritelmatomonas gaucii TaxID=2043161 RepID=A0A2N9L3D9_9BACT|nr:exported hypothetical protein [Candidatus Sulfotelmatomonas gaucii]